MTLIIVNVIGVALIVFILWWFILAKPKATQIKQDTIDIIVQNGIYQPAVITGKRGHRLHLRFIRKDDTPCSETVLFDQLDVSANLAFDQASDIYLLVDEPGEYEFTCQMGMYRGKLIIE